MKTFKVILCFLFTPIFYLQNIHAQNLVPNPGFENMILCPIGANANSSQDEIERYTSDWYNSGLIRHLDIPSQYLHECADPKGCGIPLNFTGYQHAHDGRAMAKLSCINSNPGARHFFGVKLIMPLKKGHKYDVRFYASLADSSGFGYDKLGVMFCTQRENIPDYNLDINAKTFPNYAHVYSKQIIIDKFNWTKVEDTFIADSDYQYMVVGNFFDFTQTNFRIDSHSESNTQNFRLSLSYQVSKTMIKSKLNDKQKKEILNKLNQK